MNIKGLEHYQHQKNLGYGESSKLITPASKEAGEVPPASFVEDNVSVSQDVSLLNWVAHQLPRFHDEPLSTANLSQMASVLIRYDWLTLTESGTLLSLKQHEHISMAQLGDHLEQQSMASTDFSEKQTWQKIKRLFSNLTAAQQSLA